MGCLSVGHRWSGRAIFRRATCRPTTSTVVGAITFVLCSSPLAAQSYPAGTKTALLVVGSTALGAGDAALKQRLET